MPCCSPARPRGSLTAYYATPASDVPGHALRARGWPQTRPAPAPNGHALPASSSDAPTTPAPPQGVVAAAVVVVVVVVVRRQRAAVPGRARGHRNSAAATDEQLAGRRARRRAVNCRRRPLAVAPSPAPPAGAPNHGAASRITAGLVERLGEA